jgi:hypothetical protein
LGIFPAPIAIKCLYAYFLLSLVIIYINVELEVSVVEMGADLMKDMESTTLPPYGKN